MLAFNFLDAVTVAVGGAPESVVIAPLVGASPLDLAVARTDADNLGLLENQGTGSFPAATNLATGNGPISLISADLDGLNGPDLVVANRDAMSLTVLLNNGNGTFTASTTALGMRPLALAAGQFDADSDVDLVAVLDVAQGSNSLFLLRNLGTGVLQPPESIASPGIDPSFVVAGEFNGQPGDDLAVINDAAPNVSILMNDGTGIFSSQGSLNVGEAPVTLATGDLNGDSQADLVAIGVSATQVSTFLSNGTGTFGPRMDSVLAASLVPNGRSTAIGDVDGDSMPDLAVVDADADQLRLLRGLGNGQFADQQDYAVGQSPFGVALGDLNGDGFLDAVTANFLSDDLTILLSDANPNAAQDTYSTRLDTPLNVPAPGVLENDRILGTAPLSAEIISSVAVGDLTLNPDGSFTFTPPPLFVGNVSFTYRAVADGLMSEPATVTIQVTNAAPVITPSDLLLSATSVQEGSSVSLSGSFLDVDPNQAHTVVIDWGDGSTPTQIDLEAGVLQFGPISHVYADDPPSGTPSDILPIQVTVRDPANATDDATTQITVNNVAPVPNAGPDQTVMLNQPVSLMGLFTDVGALDTHSFSWSVVASNGQTVDDADGTSFSFTPTADGFYTVTFLVADDDTGIGSDTVVITAGNPNRPPVINPSDLTLSTETVDEGSSLSLSGTFTDLDPDQAHTVVIDWGDGGPLQMLNLEPGVLSFGPLSRTYADDNPSGTPSDPALITVTVTDSEQATDSASRTITVRNVAPVATAPADRTVPEGSPVTLEGTFTDVGAADTHVLQWSVVASNGQTIADGTGASFQFTPNNDGVYTVTFRVTDDDTGTSTDQVVVTVTDVAPTLVVTGSGQATSGEPYTVNLQVVDPGNDPAPDLTIDWGDGQTSSISGGSTTATHTYALTPSNQPPVLPDTPFIRALRRRRAINPARFDFYHPGYARLFRAEANPAYQLPSTPYVAMARVRRAIAPARFDRNHPLLGYLLAREAAATPNAETYNVRLSGQTPDGQTVQSEPHVVVVQPAGTSGASVTGLSLASQWAGRTSVLDSGRTPRPWWSAFRRS